MNVSSESAVQAAIDSPHDFLSELGWFSSGAVLPMGSLGFYRAASRRSVGLAILFFFAFTVVLSVLTTVSVGVGMAGVIGEIHGAYQQGKIPEITIRNGVAEVAGPQPLILMDETTSNGAMLIAIDTTGSLTSIDRARYNEGLLLTRTDLQVLNSDQGRYQTVPLSQVNAIFSQDPLVINEQTVASAWATLSVVVSALAFIFLVIWNSLIRLMVIAVLALIFWGIGTLFRPKIGFGPFIISGLYAVVPAVYLSHLFSRSQASFFGLQTILLILFCAAGLLAALSQDQFFTAAKFSRLWTALLGVPMLIWFIIDDFAKLPSPAAQIVLWSVALLTWMAVAGVRLYFHFQDMRKTAPPAALQPPLPPAA